MSVLHITLGAIRDISLSVGADEFMLRVLGRVDYRFGDTAVIGVAFVLARNGRCVSDPNETARVVETWYTGDLNDYSTGNDVVIYSLPPSQYVGRRIKPHWYAYGTIREGKPTRRMKRDLEQAYKRIGLQLKW